MTSGRLVPIGRTNWRRAMEVCVTDQQPIMSVILSKSYVGAEGGEWEPLAYENSDGEMVAVLGLAHKDGSAEVFNFAVDHKSQGTGVGTAVMLAVIEHARNQSCSTLSLTVHPDNAAAQGLYRKAGLAPTGETLRKQPVWAIDLAENRP